MSSYFEVKLTNEINKQIKNFRFIILLHILSLIDLVATHNTLAKAQDFPTPVDPQGELSPPKPLATGDSIATLKYNINVVPNGDLAISVPLDSPPGRKGISPQVGFSYNSGRSGKDGPVGVGVELLIMPRAGAVPTRDNVTAIGNHQSWHATSRIRQRLRQVYLLQAKREHVPHCNNAGTQRACPPDQTYSRTQYDQEILCEWFLLAVQQKDERQEHGGPS